MNNTTKIFIIVSAMILIIVFSVALSMPARAATQTQSIQGMVDNSGAELTIPPGTYYGSVSVNKPVLIHARGVTLDAGGANGFTVTGKGVTIEGVTVKDAAIGVYLVGASDSMVSNCDLSHNGYGVYGDGASNNKIISNTLTYESGNGKALGDGIFLNLGGSNTVSGNTLSNNNAAPSDLFFINIQHFNIKPQKYHFYLYF